MLKVSTSIARTTVAYAAGPGDVVGTFIHWKAGQVDPHEVAETYSGQFFDQVRDLDLSAFVISSHPRRELIKDGRFTIGHRPKSTSGKSGVSFNIADVRYWLGVMWRIKRAGCAVAVITDMKHWWMLTLLSFTGVKVVPTLHCTFWPKGFRPQSAKDYVVHALNGWFWRHIASATICISPECQRQVEMIAGKGLSGPLIQARPKYYPGSFAAFKPPVWSTSQFRLLFAGRIEENKGVFDLVSLMYKLTVDLGQNVCLEVCGAGTAFVALADRVRQLKLEQVIKLHGKLEHFSMLEAIQRCNVVVVPTTAEFAEGLNKVVVEGVLAGRPVVASSVVPANEIFPNSVIEVRPGDHDEMAACILRLATDENYYNLVCSHCHTESAPFYDEAQSWGSAVGCAIQTVLVNG